MEREAASCQAKSEGKLLFEISPRNFATFGSSQPLLGTRTCCQQSGPASTADISALVLQAGTGGVWITGPLSREV
jgi:hypothetical protein